MPRQRRSPPPLGVVKEEVAFELEPIQRHEAQKPVLRGEVGCACVAREASVERGGMGERGCARRLGGWVVVGVKLCVCVCVSVRRILYCIFLLTALRAGPPFSWGVTSEGPPGGRSLSKDGTRADIAKDFCRLVGGVYYAGNLISD